VIRLGEYGVHYVPAPPDTAMLKARAEDPRTLARILAHTGWDGVVILDTKSDLEALTLNAMHAADRILIPVADRASLEEAQKSFDLLDRERIPRTRARVLFTLVDGRTRAPSGAPLHAELERLAREREWPRYRTALSRSPKVEALNSLGAGALSILHHARGTAIHTQMHELAREVLVDLGVAGSTPREIERAVAAGAASVEARRRTQAAAAADSWTDAVLSAWRRRR
jgi:cellulose biosynthesis protein BcsQ